MSENELAGAMRSRAGLYGLLSRVFSREVDEAFLAQLKGIHYPQNTGNDAIDSAYRRIWAFLCKARENTMNTLAVDYARVFLGSGSLDAEAAYPFESVYTSPRHLTMQDARDEVLAIYRSWGIDKNDGWKEGEDHLAAELEFVEALALRSAEALEAGDEERAFNLVETQRNFIADHLMRWVPKFCEDVPRFAKKDFYSAFAALLIAVLKEDLATLDDLLGDDGTQSEDADEGARHA